MFQPAAFELILKLSLHIARQLPALLSHIGMTPGSYLGEWRLGVAQSLLRKGKPIQLVSDVVGYGSASALSRAFRAQVGLSPTEWVRQYHAGQGVAAVKASA